MASLFNHCAFAGGTRGGGGGGSGGGGREEQLVGAGGDLAVSTSFFSCDFQGAKARTRVPAVPCHACCCSTGVQISTQVEDVGRIRFSGAVTTTGRKRSCATQARVRVSLVSLGYCGTVHGTRISVSPLSVRCPVLPWLRLCSLCLLQVFDMPLLPPPRFAVFISGCFQPHPTQVTSPCSQIGWWCPCSTEFTGDLTAVVMIFARHAVANHLAHYLYSSAKRDAATAKRSCLRFSARN